MEVLIESGFRCAVPTCRSILALDLHHIVEVNEGGGNEPSNLLALCPTCHALYTRKMISGEAINAWKTMLVALNHAFDQDSISNLLFLRAAEDIQQLIVSGDGVLKFSHLIGSGLATYQVRMTSISSILYEVTLTNKGRRVLDAWFSGSREDVRQALNETSSREVLSPTPDECVDG